MSESTLHEVLRRYWGYHEFRPKQENIIRSILAGRDGRPADCVLLWQKRDHVLLQYFIKKIEDDAERERSYQRYRIISRFADSPACRHRQICLHFGETPKWQRCESCDNCGSIPGWLKQAPPEPVLVPTLPRRKMPAPRTADQSVVSAATARSDFDPALADYLREWRRAMAKEKKVPAYIVLHDSTLEELCRRRPRNFAELQQVPGIGERKADVYGAEILQALRNFYGGARASDSSSTGPNPAEETLRLIKEGRSFSEIAQLRSRQPSTILGTVANLIETGKLQLRSEWVDSAAQSQIEAACTRHGLERLSTIKQALPATISYDHIRLVVAHLRAQNRI